MVRLFFLEYSGNGMALPTTDMGIETGPPGFLTKWGYFYPPPESSRQRSDYLTMQAHKLAGIGPIYARHRAGAAKIPAPGRP